MKLVADLHVHSIASEHAYSTIEEILTAAADKGLEIVGIADHGPTMPGGPHLYHFGNLRVLPEEWKGVRLLKGVEANIIDHEGNLDMPEIYLQKLDYALAGIHPFCYPGGTREENTRAMIRAMEHPLVDVIVHPGNPEYPIDPEEVLEAAMRLEKVIEINNSSLCGSRKGSETNCALIAQLVAQMGAQIIIGSDAHFSSDVGRFEEALAMCREAGVKEEQIINSSLERFWGYLERRRRLGDD
ncbi:MAG: phosphatase [Desulfitobacterium hafniense]|nr:phosphatase [Desulfitobacterium hafniense]